MRLLHRIKAGPRDGESGQVIVMIAIMAIVISAIVGLAVDVGRLYATKAQLSRAVDAAALSGILEFNGTQAGLSAAEDKAEWYFDQNEPGGASWREATANGNDNTLVLNASKSVDMTFLSLLNLGPVTVTAHAKAGFGTQYLDTVMVLDATQSMVGNPITQAKAAATSFKNILLGANPQGNVTVGVTAFRGCFKPNSTTNTPNSNCIDKTNWTRGLTSNSANLNTTISAISGGGAAAGTNVCTGLAMGWAILDGPGNHKNSFLYPENRQYLILLSDGDNYYGGSATYQAGSIGTDTTVDSNTASPFGIQIDGVDYSCAPIESANGGTGSPCPSPWNGTSSNPCYKGVYQTTDEDWESNTWNGGSGWASGSSWQRSDTSKITNSTTAPQGGSRHLRITGSDTATNATEDWESTGFSGGSGWLAGSWTVGPNNGVNNLVVNSTTAAQGGTRHLRLYGGQILESFDTATLSGGTGWDADWVRSSTSLVTFQGTNTQAGANRLQMAGNATMKREFDLSGVTEGTVSFYARKNGTGFGSTDQLRLQISTDNSNWTNLGTYSGSTLTTSYQQFSADLPASAMGDSSVWIRFETVAGSSDQAWIDTLAISRTVSATRTVDLSGLTSADLSYYIRRDSDFGAGDIVRVQASGDGTTWTTLQTHTSLTTTYASVTSSLNAFLGDSSVYIRFVGDMSSSADEAYIDTITVTRAAAASAVNVYRLLDLGSAGSAELSYYIRRDSNFGSGDEVRVQVSGDGTTWTTLRTHSTANSNMTTSYVQYTSDLAAFLGDSTVYVRFEGVITGSTDDAYIDTIEVTYGGSSATGFLNGGDGSNPGTCNEDPKPRERQLDSRTIKLAQAMKKTGVEIFVVSFTADSIPGCNLGNTTVYNDEDASHCNAVDQTTSPNPISSPSGNGPIGDTTHDGTANHRLLKCIASSSPGTLDHYYYAASANDLNVIFTTIANQIAHRLIE